jgi:hypothetical protein
MSYAGKNLSLHDDCIFIQLDEKSVVFRHKPHNKRSHYTPQNESARMLLDLLTQNAPDGISFDDLKVHLLRQYQLDDKQAETVLNEFLTDLDNFGLLGKPGGAKKVDDHKHYGAPAAKKHQAEARGHITAGGTVVTCGYVIVWYRP